ncbi:oligopeptide/dipeptide ABC transporter ATP-binding protein [Natronobiforma cellulositropha]|uniref:oligopeptide/dipeptide ABC transporter ATP-binding protein n=1 Tax=Natronobiforma cellulositropha TaxID=1679076 RepID=UPI0021D5F62A|nr:oligopeptide/dipeptide ABC transporter ATP-binding protein [Natronobiforma cellulositropha]
MTSAPVLEARNVEKCYRSGGGFLGRLMGRDRKTVTAVDDVSLALRPGIAHGIVGESGCGKSSLLDVLAGLESVDGGAVTYDGRPTAEFSRRDWMAFRRDVQIVFQNPFESLDPKLTVREAIAEPLAVHSIDDRHERIETAVERVELRPVERYLEKLPHQLSGGERQRVSIARALVLEPSVLLADEPVSMLDVSTQANILSMLSSLIDELDLSVLYVSHDISTVGYLCDEVSVMYLGEVVESAPTNRLLGEPAHPYSRALIDAVPIPDPYAERERTALVGTPDGGGRDRTGCLFGDRCPDRTPACERRPEPVALEPTHRVSCHLYTEEPTDETAVRTPVPGEHHGGGR